MLRLSLRNLAAHKVRFAMTTFAVVLGVGFVVGSFVVTDTLRQSFTGLFDEIGGNVDVSVRAVSDIDSMGGPASRGRVPTEVLEDVLAVGGVDEADGTVGGYAQMLEPDGDPVTTAGAPMIGLNWVDSEHSSLTMVEGDAPEGPDEVAIDRGTAEDHEIRVGDRTGVLLLDGRHDVTVSGIFTFGETNSLLGARLTAFDSAYAQELLGSDGYESIDVVADEGVDPDELVAAIEAVLPTGLEAVPGRTVIDENVTSTDQFIGVFQGALLGFAGIALFVSAFYINNTFAIVLGQRVREMALLRGLGASVRQLRWTVLLEAAFVGVLASVVGIAVGLLIAILLQGVLSAGGIDLPDSSLVLQPRSWIAAVVVGLGVTVVSSLAPARRVARVSPIEGMSHGYLPSEGSSRRRVAIGGVATAVGVALLALGLFVVADSTSIMVCLAVGALLVFLGVSGLSPLVAVPVIRVLGAPFARRAMPGRLARSNAMRNPHRTARTASALMIGLALVTTVFVVGESIKASFVASLERSVRADLVLSAEGFMGMPPVVAERVRALDEIEAASGVRMDRFRFDGSGGDLVAADAAALDHLIDIDVRDGSLAELEQGSIFVHRDVAEEHDLQAGDEVTVEYASGGPREVRVAGVHGDATYAGNFLVDLAEFSEAYPANTNDVFVFAATTEGVDPQAARTAVEEKLDEFPQVIIESRAEFSQTQEEQIDQFLVAINGLLGLALVIALLGIANTLALSVLERTREIGLLRAVGMSRRQVRMMVLVESALVAVFGAALGVVVGLLFGAAAASALPESLVTTVRVPVGSIIGIVVVAALFGVLAGVLPARRAARLDVLQALSHA